MLLKFVYFHQISFTMNNNKINGYNRNKTMKKIERKNYTYDGAKVS